VERPVSRNVCPPDAASTVVTLNVSTPPPEASGGKMSKKLCSPWYTVPVVSSRPTRSCVCVSVIAVLPFSTTWSVPVRSTVSPLQIVTWALSGSCCTVTGALASIAATNGDVQRAGVLWGALESLEERLATTLPQSFRDRYRHPIDTLNPEHLDTAIRHGRTLALNEVVAFALA